MIIIYQDKEEQLHNQTTWSDLNTCSNCEAETKNDDLCSECQELIDSCENEVGEDCNVCSYSEFCNNAEWLSIKTNE